MQGLVETWCKHSEAHVLLYEALTTMAYSKTEAYLEEGNYTEACQSLRYLESSKGNNTEFSEEVLTDNRSTVRG